MMASPYKSRKFIVAVGCILIATALRLLNDITGAEWVDLTKWVSGLLFAANVGQKAAEKYAPKTEGKP